MNVVIYDKKSLTIIARPIITNLEEFKNNPNLFYPNWDSEKHIWSELEYQNPVLDNGNLREATKEEIYSCWKWTDWEWKNQSSSAVWIWVHRRQSNQL